MSTPPPRISPVTQVVAIGIGAALFFVLGRFVAIPSVIPNTSISLQYGILAVFAVLFGPVVALVAGLIGHVLIDATGYGIWLSWELASGVFGLVVGVVMLRNRVREGVWGAREAIRFSLAVLLANAVAWLVVAPLGDVLIYSEPANKVWAQGVFAFLSNSITAIVLGLLLLSLYARTRTRTGSLTAEQ